MFSLDDYDYILPEKLIAQQPVATRDESRLLVLDRSGRKIAHRNFYEIERLLEPSDVLVLNNTKVIPGRLQGHKDSGGKVEILILDYAANPEQATDPHERVYQCLVKASKPPKSGTRLRFEENLTAEVLNGQKGIYKIRFHCETDFENLLKRIGHMPLPPYIRRDGAEIQDHTSYQTVYAHYPGAIAAPTAGLHFTPRLLDRLQAKEITIVYITLHVGYGTFLPVRVTDIRDHTMHAEWFSISSETANSINTAKADGRRVVAVGTTCVRTLEHTTNPDCLISPGTGACDLYIYPGYQFKTVDAMLTNFHLPKSTLLMLVSAFAGRKEILNAYQAAIKEQYRFYSYGDAMLIL